MKEIEFAPSGEFIELHNLLKVTGLCESGGTAKVAIAAGFVKVNDAPETRKAFKVRPGHRVEFEGQIIAVVKKKNG